MWRFTIKQIFYDDVITIAISRRNGNRQRRDFGRKCDAIVIVISHWRGLNVETNIGACEYCNSDCDIVSEGFHRGKQNKGEPTLVISDWNITSDGVQSEQRRVICMVGGFFRSEGGGSY